MQMKGNGLSVWPECSKQCGLVGMRTISGLSLNAWTTQWVGSSWAYIWLANIWVLFELAQGLAVKVDGNKHADTRREAYKCYVEMRVWIMHEIVTCVP